MVDLGETISGDKVLDSVSLVTSCVNAIRPHLTWELWLQLRTALPKSSLWSALWGSLWDALEERLPGE